MSYRYRSYKKYLVEWCPICGKTFKVETSNFKDYMDNLTSYVCCNHIMIDLDEEIAEQVIKLNKKGYLTLFSCSGHTIDSTGYILFDIKDMYIGNYISSALKGLKCIYKDSGIMDNSCIRFKPVDIQFVKTSKGNIYTKRNYDLYIKELVKELDVFINRLPDISNQYNVLNCKNGYA